MMRMNSIKSLLEDYFSGTTSCEEEAMLRDYYSGDQVADTHKQYAPLFEYIQEATQNAVFQQKAMPPKAAKRSWLYMVSGVAAAVLLFLGIYRYHHTETLPATDLKSFVIIDGVYSDDSEKVCFYVAQAIDRFFQDEAAGFEEAPNAIYQASKVIDDYLSSFDGLIQVLN